MHAFLHILTPNISLRLFCPLCCQMRLSRIVDNTVLCLQQLTVTDRKPGRQLVSHQNSLDLTWQSFQLTQSAPQTLLDSFVSRRIKLLTVTYVRWWRQQWNRAKTNQKALTWGRTDQFGNTFLMRLWTLTCDLVLRAWRRHCQDSVKLNQRALYLDERSFSSEVIVQTHRHRHTHMTDCSTCTIKVIGKKSHCWLTSEPLYGVIMRRLQLACLFSNSKPPANANWAEPIP